jgi:hypothetical protein
LNYDVEAAWWYRKAAEQGHTSAQYNLGNMYVRGEGVPKNDVEAYKWWHLAAAQGDEGAKKNKRILADRITKEKIAEAQKRASDFKPRSN